MRVALWIVFLAAGLLFLLENDQQTVILKLPFWGNTSPLPVGAVVFMGVILGILFCFITGVFKKIRSHLRKSRHPSPPHSPEDIHYHE